MKKALTAVLALGLVLALPGAARAGFVYTYRDGVGGYTGTQDTYLQEGSANSTMGTNYRIITDGRGGRQCQALVRFDNIFGSAPNQIPLGATINSASLTFTLQYEHRGKSFYRMLVDWAEATASWNSMTNGIQTDNVEAASAATTSGGTWGPFDVTVDVAAWAAGASNYGWAILGAAGDAHAYSSDESTVSYRPVLEVDWTPEPATMGLLALGGMVVLARRKRR